MRPLRADPKRSGGAEPHPPGPPSVTRSAREVVVARRPELTDPRAANYSQNMAWAKTGLRSGQARWHLRMIDRANASAPIGNSTPLSTGNEGTRNLPNVISLSCGAATSHLTEWPRRVQAR